MRDYTIENRSSPVSMGVQFRIVSRKGHEGPWREGKDGKSGQTLAWASYKEMRKKQSS